MFIFFLYKAYYSDLTAAIDPIVKIDFFFNKPVTALLNHPNRLLQNKNLLRSFTMVRLLSLQWWYDGLVSVVALVKEWGNGFLKYIYRLQQDAKTRLWGYEILCPLLLVIGIPIPKRKFTPLIEKLHLCWISPKTHLNLLSCSCFVIVLVHSHDIGYVMVTCFGLGGYLSNTHMGKKTFLHTFFFFFGWENFCTYSIVRILEFL